VTSGFLAAFALPQGAQSARSGEGVAPARRRGWKKALVLGGALIGIQAAWLYGNLILETVAVAAERTGDTASLPRQDLQKIIEAASDAQVNFFPGEQHIGDEHSVAGVKVRAGPRLTGAVFQRLRSEILSPHSRQGRSGQVPSCPFYPSVGFKFGDGAKEAWWLVSKRCQTAFVVDRKEIWQKKGSMPINLTAEALDNFIQWAQRAGE
jgi:hypothetical protein